MRHLFLRHPEIFLSSVSSLQAKVKLRYSLNLNFKKERAFPLFLSMNFNQTIRPRLELLKDTDFDFSDVLRGSDQDFCTRYDFGLDELEAERSEATIMNERDILWRYVPGA
jgi:hypothetical protein